MRGSIVTMGAVAGAALLTLAAPAAAQPAPHVLCESLNGETKLCPLPGLTEAFVVQTLDGQCIAGRNWGWGARGITVTNGCRAVFGYRTAFNPGFNPGYAPAPGVVAPPPRPGYGGAVQTVQCASMAFQYNHCSMDTRNGVSIGMITNQPCRQGQTWGWDRGGVWVTGNCRAYFKSVSGGCAGGGGYPGGGIGSGAGYPGGGYPGGGNPGSGIGSGAGIGNGYPGNAYPGGGIGSGAEVSGQIIQCSSWERQPARCPAHTRNGVALVQVRGGQCTRNRSWGWDENGIWVNSGCRATFRLN